MDLPGGIDAKVGPFPIWVWGVGLGGAIVIYLYVKNSQNATSTTPVDTSSGMVDSSLGGVPSSSVSSGYPTVGSTTDYTNAQWSSAALTAADQFGLSPLGLQTTLDKYLNGETLNSSEQSAVNKILGYLGAPPEGVSGMVNGGQSILNPPAPKPTPTGGGNTAKPTSTPKPKPRTVSKPKPAAPKMYQIKWGDTLSGIAQNNHTSVQHLMSLNPQIKNPNLIYAGKSLRVG